jgi:4-hydroxy-4-methyl-2-oxoglutarate aldolase
MTDILAGFEWTTPFIADACVQLSLPVRVGPYGLKPNIAGVRAAGPARPARHAGSTDVFLEAIAGSNTGDVLVIDNGGRHDEGCIGDLVVGEAFMSGMAATVCWGAHRDTAAILSIGAKVWSLGVCPNGPLELRRRHETALLAANIGSVTVTLEDYVFADDDGVVVVATADLARIIETAARLLKGVLLRSQLDLDTYVAKRSVDPNFTFRDHLKSFGGAIEI